MKNNTAIFAFGNVDSMLNFLTTGYSKTVSKIEVLGPCELRANIKNLQKFLKVRSFINATIFFE